MRNRKSARHGFEKKSRKKHTERNANFFQYENRRPRPPQRDPSSAVIFFDLTVTQPRRNSLGSPAIGGRIHTHTFAQITHNSCRTSNDIYAGKTRVCVPAYSTMCTQSRWCARMKKPTRGVSIDIVIMYIILCVTYYYYISYSARALTSRPINATSASARPNYTHISDPINDIVRSKAVRGVR